MNVVQKMHSILTSSERKGMVGLLCLMLFGATLEMAAVGLLFPVVLLMGREDLAANYPRIQNILAVLGNPSQQFLIGGAILILFGTYLIKNMFLALLAWRQVRITNDMQVRIQQQIFTAYLHQPYTFHLQKNSTLLGHNVAEVSVVITAVNHGLNVVTDSMTLLCIVTLLLMVEPVGVLLVMFVFGTATALFHYYSRSRISNWAIARQRHNILLNKTMYEGLASAKELQLLGREGSFLEKFHGHNLKAAWVSGSHAFMQQIPRMWLELLAVAGMALLVLGMLMQESGTEKVMPTLAIFAAAAFRLIPSINRLIAGVQGMRFSIPSVNLIYEQMKLTESEAVGARKSTNSLSKNFEQEICMQNIGYTYPNASFLALDGITIRVKKGESIGFIGSSGSGKSTLVDVLLGLLPPGSGKVLVDGQDIQHGMRNWQKQIGYVPQVIYLTDDTLRRNVAFGLADEEIDELAVQRAIKAAQLDELVASLPDGVDIVVGERGIRLSGGQRQRIGIARALYHDPAVLVLDEATSALDSITEQDVMSAVMALRESKTILIVAHRLSTVEKCNRLYRLEAGRIVDQGSPDRMFESSNVAYVPG